MTNLNIFQNYFPDLSEIPESAALDARKRIETYVQAGWPELDMRPNTPFGDFHLTPFAYMVAGLEIALARVRSDLNTENVANGIIYDCDFVRLFLNNFAVTARDHLEASGVVRAVFNTEREHYLDRSVVFGFGNSTFRLYTPNPGGITIRAVGDTVREGYNDIKMVDRGDGTYSADLPLVGLMPVQVDAGDSGTMTQLPEEMISLTALSSFLQGTPESSLPALAAKSRATVYAAGNGTPGGILRFLNQEFPGLISASVVVSSDVEMMRDKMNPLGFSSGQVDVYARSGGYGFNDSQVVRLVYDESADRYMAKLHLSGQPYLMNSVTDTSGVALPPDHVEIYSQSSDGLRADMAAAAYSELEQLYIVLRLPLDSVGVPLLQIQYDAADNAYVEVVVDYRTDPLLPAIRNALTSREFSPIGVDVLVRSFIPVTFKKFLIKYTRKPGTTVNLETAKNEVVSYTNKVGPPSAYSESRLHDGVFLAGAHDVVEVETTGELHWSIAKYFIPAGEANPLEDYAACVVARRTPPKITFPSIRSLRVSYSDPFVGTDSQTNVAAGLRNMTYILDSDKVTFSEEV